MPDFLNFLISWELRGHDTQYQASQSTKRRQTTMPSMKTALKSIRKLAQTEASSEHFVMFNEQIRAEKNDRGAAILAATNVENALQYALRRRLVVKEAQYESLFGLNSPLGTFDNKIRVAFAVKIFGEQTERNLELIRVIRNTFAHAHIPITFETEQVKDVCKFLVVPELLPPFSVRVDKQGRVIPRQTPRTERETFCTVCEYLAHNFVIYGSLCFQTHRPPPQDDRYEIYARPKPLP